MIEDVTLLEKPLSKLLTLKEAMHVFDVTSRSQIVRKDDNRLGEEFDFRYCYIGGEVQGSLMILALADIQFAAIVLDARELNLLPDPFLFTERKQQVQDLKQAKKITLPPVGEGEPKEFTLPQFLAYVQKLVDVHGGENFNLVRLDEVLGKRSELLDFHLPAQQYATVAQYAKKENVSRQTIYTRIRDGNPSTVEFGPLKLIPV